MTVKPLRRPWILFVVTVQLGTLVSFLFSMHERLRNSGFGRVKDGVIAVGRLLQERSTALRSSLLVGVTWAYWHVPLMLMTFKPDQDGTDGIADALMMTLVIYPLMTLPAAILQTALFNTARGLLLIPIAFHALHNELNARMDFEAPSEAALEQARGMSGIVLLGSLWLTAGLTILVLGRRNLSRRDRTTTATMLDRTSPS